MTQRRQRHAITAEDAAHGVAAECTCRIWLDASQAPYVYLDQSILTVPKSLRSKIKRPDYLIGVPGVGLVAVDVKSKTIYPDDIIFDLGEVQKLRTYARMFHQSVYFACLDVEHGPQSFWVNLDHEGIQDRDDRRCTCRQVRQGHRSRRRCRRFSRRRREGRDRAIHGRQGDLL